MEKIQKQPTVNLPQILTTLLNLPNWCYVVFLAFSINHLPSSTISVLHTRLMAYISSTLHSALHIIGFQTCAYLRHFKPSKIKIILVFPWTAPNSTSFSCPGIHHFCAESHLTLIPPPVRSKIKRQNDSVPRVLIVSNGTNPKTTTGLYYIQLWTAHFRGDIGKLEKGDQREKGLKT